MDSNDPALRRLCDRGRLTVTVPVSYARFPPLPADHPLVTDCDLCPACRRAFRRGDVVTLRSVGPGDDPDQRQRARAGVNYIAVAIPVHYACATGQEP